MKQATTNQLDSSSIRTKSFKKWYIIALGTFIYLYVVSFGAFVRSLTRASIEDYSKIPCIKNEFDIMKEKLFFNYCEIEKSIIIIASILLNTAIYKYYKRSTYSKDDIISIAFAGLYYLIFIFYVVYSTIKSLNKTRLPSPCLSVDTDLYINVKNSLVGLESALRIAISNANNFNTAGYKYTFSTFTTVYSEAMSSGTKSTNPIHFGSSMTLGSTSTDYGQGNLTLGTALDSAIVGEGFYVISSSAVDFEPGSPKLFTRAGRFQMDSTNTFLTDSFGGFSTTVWHQNSCVN